MIKIVKLGQRHRTLLVEWNTRAVLGPYFSGDWYRRRPWSVDKKPMPYIGKRKKNHGKAGYNVFISAGPLMFVYTVLTHTADAVNG